MPEEFRDLVLIPYVCNDELWPLFRKGDFLFFDPHADLEDGVVALCGFNKSPTRWLNTSQGEMHIVPAVVQYKKSDQTFRVFSPEEDRFVNIDDVKLLGICVSFMQLYRSGNEQAGSRMMLRSRDCFPYSPLYFPGMGTVENVESDRGFTNGNRISA